MNKGGFIPFIALVLLLGSATALSCGDDDDDSSTGSGPAQDDDVSPNGDDDTSPNGGNNDQDDDTTIGDDDDDNDNDNNDDTGSSDDDDDGLTCADAYFIMYYECSLWFYEDEAGTIPIPYEDVVAWCEAGALDGFYSLDGEVVGCILENQNNCESLLECLSELIG